MDLGVSAVHPAIARGGDADQDPPGIYMTEFFHPPGNVGDETLQFSA
jgi:hypothetical protein